MNAITSSLLKLTKFKPSWGIDVKGSYVEPEMWNLLIKQLMQLQTLTDALRQIYLFRGRKNLAMSNCRHNSEIFI